MNWNKFNLNSFAKLHYNSTSSRVHCLFSLGHQTTADHMVVNVLVLHVCQYMAVCGFLVGGFFFCQYWFWMVTASMETEMCFVDVISLKLFAPELYLKNIY